MFMIYMSSIINQTRIYDLWFYQILIIGEYMKYLFESKKALDMYYELIKDLGIDAEPNEQNDCVYITEKFMSECFEVYLSKYTS